MTQRISRRSIVAGSLLAPAAAFAQSQAAASKSTQTKFWTKEYWAEKPGAKGPVKLAMYRKRAAAPKAGEKGLPVFLMVHGSSNSSLSSFDLSTPGKGEYSLMNVFAKLNFDCWTLDHENYGRSSQTDGNSDIASGVEDLRAAVEVIVRETGQQKVHLFGESSGAIRAGAYAQAVPSRVDRLVLGAFTYKGENSPTLTERAKQLEYYKTHNRRLRDRKMIDSIFTRDKAGTTDPAIAGFLAEQELKFGDQVPTGTYLDMTSKLPLVDPKKVPGPVLLIRGEYDGIATMNDLMDFFSQLPSGDKQFVVVPGIAHNLILSTNRELFWHAMHAFLAMPKPIVT
jgi:alpha-beta hydrolase superfamily lysophospholipase